MLPIPEHLQESLRELQQHYLRLRDNYTEKLQLVKTQLFHVDSLLSGTIAPPPNLAQNIQELQEYYRCVESELVSLELEIISKLSHVEALVGLEGDGLKTINLLPEFSKLEVPLPDPSPLSESEPEPESESESGLEPIDCSQRANAAQLPLPIEEEPSPEEKQEPSPEPVWSKPVGGDDLKEQGELKSAPTTYDHTPEIPNTYSVQSFIKTLHINTQSAFKDYTKNGGGITISEIDGVPTLKITVTSQDFSKRVQSRIEYYNEQFNRWLGSHGNIIVETLSRLETTKSSTEVVTSSDDRLVSAIAQLLKDNQGTILHIDFIVRSIYGTMSRDDTNRVTKNTLQILDDGVKNGGWDVDPDNPNCYTLNYLSLLR